MSRAVAARRMAKVTAYSAIELSGGFALLRWLHRQQVPVLCYHSVIDMPVPPLLAASGLHIDLGAFRRHMEFIARHYRVVPLLDVVNAHIAGERLPDRSLVLTFDDGYANNFELAVPILRELGFTATIFLATDYLGREQLYWWDELAILVSQGTGQTVELPGWGSFDLRTHAGRSAAMRRGHALLATADLAERRACLSTLSDAVGRCIPAQLIERLRPATWDECRAAADTIDFGGHTASHRLLDGIPAEAAQRDCERCRGALYRELGEDRKRAFCYPQGRWTPDVKSFLRSLDFAGAVWATDVRSEEQLLQHGADLMQIPRIGVHSDMNVPVLSANAAGFRALVGRALR